MKYIRNASRIRSMTLGFLEELKEMAERLDIDKRCKYLRTLRKQISKLGKEYSEQTIEEFSDRAKGLVMSLGFVAEWDPGPNRFVFFL